MAWYRQAAEQGHTEAQFNLGHSYATGEGVLQDDVAAVAWFHKAAEQGYAKAQYNLGFMCATGRGVSRDLVEAVEWWFKAATKVLRTWWHEVRRAA